MEELANKTWIEMQFGGIDFNDKRLNKRIEKLANNMIANPSASIPEQNKKWKDTKGAYRFFDSDKVSFNEIIKPHIKLTKNEVEKRGLILAIQDTCYISYSDHPSVTGLSKFHEGIDQSAGIILHNTIAVDPTKTHPEVIGILDQYIHRRPAIKDKKDDWKETKLWQEASQRIGVDISKAHLIEVMDREGDVFDIMKTCMDLKHDFLIRGKSDRRINQSSEDKLFSLIKTFKSSGVISLKIRKKDGQIQRKALLTLSFSNVILCGPKDRVKENLNCNVVYVLEKNPPKNQEPLEWILLTSVEVNSFEDAHQIVKWYKNRWIIEEYHKCIKSGCGVEQKQLKEEFRLENFLGIANIIAIRLLQLRDSARLTPQISTKEIIDPLKVKVLLKYYGIKEKEISIYEYYRLVAKIGGFLGRKSDVEPGWQTLWKGETKLMLLTEGARLFLAGELRCG